jgi:FSR family fosmidomycin resistance protein-like MFS transporter
MHRKSPSESFRGAFLLKRGYVRNNSLNMEKEIIKEVSTPTGVKLQATVYPILFAVSLSHLLNDLLQSVIPSMFPLLKEKYHLSFSQVGLITFVFQITASILQPFVGSFTDKRPQPYSFAIGMFFSISGIILLAFSTGFSVILLSVGLVGMGSSIFHPEASKLAFYASGGKRGLAQSIFQLGGNAGSAVGPLLVAAVVIPFGQPYVVVFVLAGILAIFVSLKIGAWYKRHLFLRAKGKVVLHDLKPPLNRKMTWISIGILLTLMFSKFFYSACISNYFTFYLIEKFHVTVQQSQLYLFTYLISVAAGTLAGGFLGDKFGRKIIIWVSILGVAPFAILLPYANLMYTGILISLIGLILSSAFSAIIVYSQELLPHKIGMISGLFFGFAFGMAGLGSAILGYVADITSVRYIFSICSFLPLMGIITAFLPDLKKRAKKTL